LKSSISLSARRRSNIDNRAVAGAFLTQSLEARNFGAPGASGSRSGTSNNPGRLCLGMALYRFNLEDHHFIADRGHAIVVRNELNVQIYRAEMDRDCIAKRRRS